MNTTGYFDRWAEINRRFVIFFCISFVLKKLYYDTKNEIQEERERLFASGLHVHHGTAHHITAQSNSYKNFCSVIMFVRCPLYDFDWNSFNFTTLQRDTVDGMNGNVRTGKQKRKLNQLNRRKKPIRKFLSRTISIGQEEEHCEKIPYYCELKNEERRMRKNHVPLECFLKRENFMHIMNKMKTNAKQSTIHKRITISIVSWND